MGAEIPTENAATKTDRLLLEGLLRQGFLPLQPALEGVQLSGWISPQATFTESWNLAVPRGRHSFFGVAGGQCRLDVTESAPVTLHAGDLAITKDGAARALFGGMGELANDDQSRDRHVLYARPVIDSPATMAQIISGGFVALDSGSASFLAAFPPVFVVPGKGGQFVDWVDHLLGLLLAESAIEGPIASDVVNRLLGILFIKVMRYALEACQRGSESLFNASADPEVGVALVRIHQRLANPWTVAGLAREVGLCRSTFAARFLLAVGKPPLQYLRDVRMQRRERPLTRADAVPQGDRGQRPDTGRRLPFSAAFRRWTGKSPGEYRDFQHAELTR